MRHILLAAIVGITFLKSGPAEAQIASASTEIQSVITEQIAAFAEDDFVEAFDFAAKNIQRLFVTPENFGVMVKRGYPMVHRAAEVQFGALRADGNALWQRVVVRDGNGVVHALEYLMISDGDTWRIAAVQLVQPDDVGA